VPKPGGGRAIDSYWSSLEAEIRRHSLRRAETAHLHVVIEPQRKRRRGAEDLDRTFQSATAEQLARQRLHGWPAAPLSLDLSFTTRSTQPAAVHTYVKHYQDLLEAGGTGEGHAPRLYRDDRQVKMLFVQAWNARRADVDPGIQIKCRPRRHVVAEFESAHRLGYQEHLDDARDDEFDEFSDGHFSSGAQGRLAGLSVDLAELLAILDRRRLQESLLRANDNSLASFLTLHAAELLTDKPGPAIRRLLRLGSDGDAGRPRLPRARTWLDMLIRVPLPGLPTRHGESGRFRESVIAACDAFRERHPHLRPLFAPLRITLLVVPPTQGKDLDNVIRTVVGGVHAVLAPEPWPITREMADHLGVSHQSSVYERHVTSSVSSYQVIELARSAEDPPEGSLSMVLGSGDSLYSVWAEAEHFVDEVLAAR
jgi:hypothetical protein